MNIKKLNIYINEHNLEKKLLQDIIKEVSYENEFMFWRRGHTDHNEHQEWGYSEYLGWDCDYEDKSDEKRHNDHIDYNSRDGHVDEMSPSSNVQYYEHKHSDTSF